MRIFHLCVFLFLQIFFQCPCFSECFEFNFDTFSLGQVFDSLQNFFSSPLLKTLRDSLSASIEEDCQFKCSNGKYPRPKSHYVPKSNGCGVPGLQVKVPKYLLGELEDCCSSHDICYGTCNADKDECDWKFKKCLYGICRKFEKYISEDVLKGCKSVAKTMYVAVMTMGCKHYLDAQREACTCNWESYDNHYDL